MYKTENLLDLNHTITKEHLLNNYEYPWQIIPEIKNIILEVGKKLDKKEYKEIKENVWVHISASLDNNITIIGPAIIGKESQIKHCAYIRENVIIGNKCVIGNSCEVKNSIIFDETQVPHFNYVGDSVMGYKSHMGAGAIISNLKSDQSNITVKDEKQNIDTKLRKFGAIIGDFVEVGCNSVMNPGTIIGRNTIIYPLSRIRGIIKENSIYKGEDNIVEKE